MKNKLYLYLSLISVVVCIAVISAIIFLPGLAKKKAVESIHTKIEIIWELESPDSRYNAVMFSKEAGATVGVRYHLSIIPVGESISEDDTANVFSNYGIYDIEWQDENTLLVKKYEEGTDYYKIEEYNGIKIKYLSPSETREYEKSKREALQ